MLALPWKLQYYGGFFLHVKCLFSPFEGPCFSFLEAIFSMCVCVCGGGGSLCGEIFKLVHTFCGAHALAARVVANMAHWENLREIARLNLLINFGAHFHIIFEKTNEMIRC